MRGLYNWKCEVCQTMRMDRDISVVVLRKEQEGGGSMQRNVKYCNDNPDCLDGAVKIAKRDVKIGSEIKV